MSSSPLWDFRAGVGDYAGLYRILTLTGPGKVVTLLRPPPGEAPLDSEAYGTLCARLNTCCPECGYGLVVVVSRFLTGRLEGCRVGFGTLDSDTTAESDTVMRAPITTPAVGGSRVSRSASVVRVPQVDIRTDTRFGPSKKLSPRFLKIRGTRKPIRKE